MSPTPPPIPRLILAPMEGVLDAIMRDQLTAIGGFERCVTEFVRVSQTLLPNRVFHRYAPELKQGGVTPSGVPVFVQLLGSDPTLMAENAARAAALGIAFLAQAQRQRGAPAVGHDQACGPALRAADGAR